MYSQFEANERHYVRIKTLTDCSYQDFPYVTLGCYGYIFSRDEGSASGVAKDSYHITVRVYGKLMGFVTNELKEGDTVLIIGHSAMAKCNGYSTRVTVAEQIYKADWEHYFN